MKTTRDIAREAGLENSWDQNWFDPAFERFANMVREECAKTCEELGAEGYGTLYIAAAIRGAK